MIRDRLKLQGKDLELLESGHTILLETEKHRRLIVKINEEDLK